MKCPFLSTLRFYPFCRGKPHLPGFNHESAPWSIFGTFRDALTGQIARASPLSSLKPVTQTFEAHHSIVILIPSLSRFLPAPMAGPLPQRTRHFLHRNLISTSLIQKQRCAPRTRCYHLPKAPLLATSGQPPSVIADVEMPSIEVCNSTSRYSTSPNDLNHVHTSRYP